MLSQKGNCFDFSLFLHKKSNIPLESMDLLIVNFSEHYFSFQIEIWLMPNIRGILILILSVEGL